MSDIDKLAQNIKNVGGKIDVATTEAQGVAQEVEDAGTAAADLGAESAADALGKVKDQLDALAATLQGASVRADGIRARAVGVGAGNRRGAGVAVAGAPTASADPAAVPSPPRSKGSPTDKKKPRSFRQLTDKTAEKVEDIQDAVDSVKEGWDALTQTQTRPPAPPKVTSAGTQAQGSPPSASSAPLPGSGIEASSLAGAGVAFGVAVFGAKELFRRARRALKTPEQFPEGEEPPPTDKEPPLTGKERRVPKADRRMKRDPQPDPLSDEDVAGSPE